MTSFSRVWQSRPAARDFTVNPNEISPEAFRPLWRHVPPAGGDASDASSPLASDDSARPAIATEHAPTERNDKVLIEREVAGDRENLGLPAEVAIAEIPPGAAAGDIAPAVISCADLDEKLAQARNEGIESGRQEGRAEAQAELAAQRTELANLLSSLTAEFQSPGMLLDPIKRLAAHIAQKVVRSELESRAEVIQNLVTGCLAEAGQANVLRLRLNGADAEMLRGVDGALFDKFEVVADDNLSRGSVVVEITDGWIEDLVDDRWAAVLSGLGAVHDAT